MGVKYWLLPERFLGCYQPERALAAGRYPPGVFPNTSDANFMVSESELAMIHRLPDVLPREAVVLVTR